MGGVLKSCGCFDGPWSADDCTLVSVRCVEHAGEPALDGYVPMRTGDKSPLKVKRQGMLKQPVGRHRRR